MMTPSHFCDPIFCVFRVEPMQRLMREICASTRERTHISHLRKTLPNKALAHYELADQFPSRKLYGLSWPER